MEKYSCKMEFTAVVDGLWRHIRVMSRAEQVQKIAAPSSALLTWRSRARAEVLVFSPDGVLEILPGETQVFDPESDVSLTVGKLVDRGVSDALSDVRNVHRKFAFDQKEGHEGLLKQFQFLMLELGAVRAGEDQRTRSMNMARQMSADLSSEVKEQVEQKKPTPSAKALSRGRKMSRVLSLVEGWSELGDRQQLSENFLLKELLGEGGFANVFRAVHIKTNREVAVKIMLLEAGESPQDQQESLSAEDGSMNCVKANASGAAIMEIDNDGELEKEASSKQVKKSEHTRRVRNFEWEVRIMRKIRDELPRHPNLVGLFAVCYAADPPRTCLVMEKLDGGELFERIVERTHYTEKDAAHLFRSLTRALHDLHRIGIVHRDIKPENVIFTDRSHYSPVKLADFGTAKDMNHQEDDPFKDKKIGSPGYAAPEVQRLEYDSSCDVWSMGVLLYCLLVGYMPFPEGFMQILKVMTGQYEFHEEYWSEISEEAKDLIQKMLTVQKSKRITTQEILVHPWVAHVELETKGEPKEKELQSTQERMKTLNMKRKFKSAAVAAVWAAKMRINKMMKEKTLESIKKKVSRSRSSSHSSSAQ